MKARQLLMAPLLTPLLAVLFVSALNLSPKLSFRVLTWETPQAPLGIWLASAALGGAALSGMGVGLALRQGAERKTRRRVSRAEDSEPWSGRTRRAAPWPRPSVSHQPDPPEESWPEPPVESRGPTRVSVAPERAPGDPAPTVVVPFRVLRRPASHPEDGNTFASMGGTPATPASKARVAVPVPAADDWDDEGGQEW